jgi:peroxiredoxin
MARVRLNLVAAVLTLMVLAGCSQLPAVFSQTAPVEGSRAPDFQLQTLDGQRVRLSELRGQVVLINFWATWCAPCRLEMPAIQDRYERGGFEVLAVDFDESPELVQAFVNELGLSFPVLLDPGADIQKLYQVRGYPTSFFIDTEGIIRIIQIGIMTEEELDANLQELGVLN